MFNKKLKIFKSNMFGIELEVCCSILSKNSQVKLKSDNECADKYFKEKQKIINLYNDLIDSDKIPSSAYHNDYFSFSGNVMYHSSDSGKKWTMQNDSSIIFKNATIPMEIVSPVMYCGDQYYNSVIKLLNLEENSVWLHLRKTFPHYYEGLFLIFTWYQLMINNEKPLELGKNVVVHNYNIKNGYHIHLSNLYMKNNRLGRFMLIHYLRNFYFFENLIESFLAPNRDNNEYAVKISKEHNNVGFYNDILSIIKNVHFSPSIPTISYDEIATIFTKTFGRYFTINLQNRVNEGKPIRLENRFHQSSNDMAEIYNWIVLNINFLSTCIYQIYHLASLKDHHEKHNAAAKSDHHSYFKKININFMTANLMNNDRVNMDMFNLFFDKFIKNGKLKAYYYNKCRSNDIKKYPLVTDNKDKFHTHNDTYFDSQCKILKSNPLTELQCNLCLFD